MANRKAKNKTAPPSNEYIIIRGAREHNLKNIDLDIPRNRMIVVTGLSGSGKSSLAFDTIYAEGQRRYVESLSSYARQFLGQMEKPDIDYIEGLSPAIAIDQKATSKNPRSTVGTITEIYDYLRLLFARVGIPHCPQCGKVVVTQTPQDIVDKILSYPDETKVLVLAPVVRHRKGNYKRLFDDLRSDGFTRLRIDGDIYMLSDDINLGRYEAHDIDIVVDRLVVKPEIKQRLTESVELSLQRADGLLVANFPDTDEDVTFSVNFACPECGISLGEITPNMFSFNSPHGACEECKGLGSLKKIDPDLVIDPTRALVDEAVLPYRGSSSGYLTSMIHAASYELGIDPTKPLSKAGEDRINALLYGAENIFLTFTFYDSQGNRRKGHFNFQGIIPWLESRYTSTSSDYIRDTIEQYMSDRPCPACGGKRLKPVPLSVIIGDLNIWEVTQLTVERILKYLNTIKLSGSRLEIARQIIKEIRERTEFLNNVGLDYITLSRPANTLSGGESQRIRLATQIGSRLTGVLYILDEPTIGLHQRDNKRLVDTLKGLRDLGNTVIIVEHDEGTIRSSDYIIDLGPGAGVEGGYVIATGPVEEVAANPKSITGKFLSLDKKRNLTKKSRPGNGHYLKVINPRHNNLKGMDISFPLGRFIAVTGVSGSGKSSLVNETLYRHIAHHFHLKTQKPGKADGIEGIEWIDSVSVVDQSPIGRTPRSNPATYTKVFDKIREVFTNTRESRARGYTPGRFSFNVRGGRCEACQGDGLIKIEMHFLPDVYVRCDICSGKRYNRETLEIRYKGKNIYEVLDMTITQAAEFFADNPPIKDKLDVIQEVGLGYIKLGQSATTLSGGEAQRVKLAFELSKKKQGNTLYILDEPTTGLHYFDVQKLLSVLHKLVDLGNTVIIIEHNLDVIASSDYVIDLGPEGGDRGGEVVAIGSPYEVSRIRRSYTGRFLTKMFNPSPRGKTGQASKTASNL